jgi:hypothetical protein
MLCPYYDPSTGEDEGDGEGHPQTPGRNFSCTSSGQYHCEPFSKLGDEKARQSVHSSDRIAPPQ